jgi:tripartite-type tricarboxylate transporter receptor subunit TctC
VPTKRAFLRTLAASLSILSGIPAAAETYPSRSITIIVPFPAGGPTDVLARILAERMRAALGQTVVVENVSGAGGTIAVTKAVRSAPDGYTLSIGQLTSHVMSGAAYVTNYDLLKDLEPVAMLTLSPLWMIGRNGLPDSLPEVIAWLKANPDKASVATIGTGSPAHVWAVFFQEQTGTRFQLVPYRGAAPAIQDMTAGRIDLASLEASSTLPYVKSGQIKAFAMLTKTRWSAAPNVPTTGVLERALGAQGHAQGDHRQAQQCRSRDLDRSRGAPAPGRDGAGDPAARSADARGAGRTAPGRHREMVADHEGGQHQVGVTLSSWAYPSPGQPGGRGRRRRRGRSLRHRHRRLPCGR